MEAMQDQKLENAMEDPPIPTDSTMPSQVKEQWITVFSEKFVAQPHSQTDSSSQSDDSNNEKKLENTMEEDPPVATDPTMPSQIKQEPWITVYSEKFVAQPHSQTDSNSQSDDSNDEKKVNLTGKWLLFTDIELEDEEKGMTPHDMAWQFVKELVEEGEIYAAKCSTAWEGQYPTRDGRVSGVICCYTKDYTDKKDVKRVADAIRRVYSYPENMFYKTDEDTLAKKYRHLGNQCVSIYKHTVDNEMYERDLVIRNQWNIINV